MTPSFFTGNISPFVKPYQFNKNNNDQKKQNENVDKDPNSGNTSYGTSAAVGTTNTQSINKLLTSQGKDINVSDIIKDFKSTMTAIGVPKEVGMKIIEKVKTAHVEASKENPSISEIQNNLCKAAEELDAYISEALGKPSHVVKTWMDALLLQKVDYSAYDPIQVNTSTGSQTQLNAAASVPNLPKQGFTPQNALNTFPKEQGNSMISNITGMAAPMIPPTSPVNEPPKAMPNAIQPLGFESAEEIQATPMLQPSEIKHQTPSIPAFQAQIQQPIETIKPEALLKKEVPLVKTTITPQQEIPAKTEPPKELNQAEKLYNNAKKALFEGDKNRALGTLEQSLAAAKFLKDEKTQMKVHGEIATIYDRDHNLKTAMKHYGEALQLAHKQNDTDSMAKLHYNIGSIYDDLNMLDKAKQHYNASLSYDGEIGNVESQALTLNDLANIDVAQQKYDSAISYYTTALDMAEESGNSTIKSDILYNIGSTYKTTGQDKQAINYFRESLKVDEAAKNYDGFNKTLLSMVDIYESHGLTEKAQKCYKKVLANARLTNNRQMIAIASQKLDTIRL